MKTSSSFLRRFATLIVYGCAFVWADLDRSAAQTFRITDFFIDPQGTAQVRYESDPNFYYALHRSGAIRQIGSAVELALGVSGEGSLSDPNRIGPDGTVFYRVRRINVVQPLDSDGDGLNDVVELQHREFLNPLDSEDGRLLTIGITSPADGEQGVAVTRETILHLSLPLSNSVALTTNHLYATFGGRRLLSRIELSRDSRTATLFYLEPLPGSARVNVVFDSSALTDLLGRPIDPDGDGRPGGQKTIAFETLNLTPLAGTAVIGRVFASELMPGPGNANSINRPLEGVTITVDGREETLRAVTDAMGIFKLEPVPPGKFFVKIDGRTAVGSQWPDGDYYPFVGKEWNAVAGKADNMAGGTGEIYLPLIQRGTLQAVSQTATTTIGFPPAILANNPTLAGVSVAVPANTLFSDDGTRGGKVGIAPVSPDRLPGPLPPGLKFPVVITVQTDGPSNFDRPVPVRFPNLPDPSTGQKLPPGAKSALWSFNHDTGRWEIAGPMTVSADGQFIESDPGTGIRQPGWHGTQPGTAPGPAKPNSACDPKSCALSTVLGLLDCGMSFIPFASSATCLLFAEGYGTTRSAIDCMLGDGIDCGASIGFNFLGAAACLVHGVPALGSIVACTGAGFSIVKNCAECGGGNGPSSFSGSSGRVELNSVHPAATLSLGAGQPHVDSTVAQWQQAQARLQAHVDFLQGYAEVVNLYLGSSVWTSAVDLRANDALAASAQLAEILGGIAMAVATTSDGGALMTPAELAAIKLLPKPGSVSDADIDKAADYLNRTTTLYRQGVRTHQTAGRTDFMDKNQMIAALKKLDEAATTLAASGFAKFDYTKGMLDFNEAIVKRFTATATPDPASPIFYALTDEGSSLVLRGQFTGDGRYDLTALKPNTFYRAAYFEPKTLTYGTISFLSRDSGTITPVPPTLLAPLTDTTDTDADGLADVAEFVVGTDPTKADTDGDGVNDRAELQQGTDPLDGLPVRTGIIATATTPGVAIDICPGNQVVAVADSEAGISVFSIFSGLKPTLVAQVDTAGTALAVSCTDKFVAVADGAAGLVIIDISVPAQARIVQQLSLDGTAQAVTTDGTVAFAGAGERVTAVEMETGTILQTLNLERGETVQDLAISRGTLYALTDRQVHAISMADGDLVETGSAFLSGAVGKRRLRLFAGGGLAYATFLKGYEIFDLTNPNGPVFLRQIETREFGWKQIVANGTGLGVACVGPNPTDDGPHDVSLYDLNPGGTNNQFQLTIGTPGIATALALYNGLAYVADGNAGLQVLNYLPYDSLGKAPTVNLTASFPLNPAATQEGQVAWIAANVGDDVQVRSVEFYVDGKLAATDGTFPFEYSFVTPIRAAGKTQFTIRARAIDTGGNAGLSDELAVNLLPDATPPKVKRIVPGDGRVLAAGSVHAVSVRFNEPLNPASVTSSSLQLFSAGPDHVMETADDILLPGGALAVREYGRGAWLTFQQPLPPDNYRIVLGSSVTDLAGNALGAGVTAEFQIVLADVSGGNSFTGAGNINVPDARDSYAFIAKPGEVVYFDEQANDCISFLKWRCIDQTGALLFDQTLGASINGGGCGRDPGLMTLTNGGTYTITVYGETTTSTNDYQFSIWVEPLPDEFDITVGTAISDGMPGPGAGNIEAPGARDIYRFTASPGQVVYFDEQSGDCLSLFKWRCEDEAGTLLFDETLGSPGCGEDAGLKTLALGGIYKITVYGMESATGTYKVQIWNVPAPDEFNIAAGAAISDGMPAPGAGNIEVPGARDIYRFTATPGQVIYFDEQSGDCLSPFEWRCEDEAGTILFEETLGSPGCGKDAGLKTLALGGIYKITVYAVQSATGTYKLQIWNVPPPDQFTIAIGDTVSQGVPGVGAGEIKTPGTEDIYIFNGMAGQTAYFDEQSGDCFTPLRWTCIGPDGKEVFDEDFGDTLGKCGHDPGAKTLTSDGAYQIIVHGVEESTGTYQFQIRYQQ